MGFVCRLCTFVLLCLALTAAPALAQQTGAISGKVVDASGGVLPGVTVEARSDVLPTPRVTTTGAAGDYRLPALPPGNYTLTFVLSGMQNVTRQALVQLGQETPWTRRSACRGVTESVEVTASVSLIDRDSAHDQERRLERADHGAAGRPGVPRSRQADSRRAVHAGPDPRPERGRQRPGQRLPVRRRQRDAAALRHALGRAGVARHRAGDDDQGRRASGGLRPLRRIHRSTPSASPARTATPARSATSSRAASMSAELKSGSQSRYEQDRDWLTANVGGPVVPNKVYFYGSYYRPENVAREPRQPLRRRCRDYERTRNEGFGKVTVTPVSSVLLNVSYRDSKRPRPRAIGSPRTRRRRRAPATRRSSRSAIARRLVGHQLQAASRRSSTRTSRSKRRGLPDYHRRRRRSATPSARGSTSRAWIRRACSRCRSPIAEPGGVQRVHPAAHRSLRLRQSRERRARTGGGTVGYRHRSSTMTTSSASGASSATTSRSGRRVTPRPPRRLSAVHDAEDLLRSSNGWGSISVPGGRLNFSGTPIFYTARYQQQPGGGVPHRSTRSTARRASRSTTPSAGAT